MTAIKVIACVVLFIIALCTVGLGATLLFGLIGGCLAIIWE